MIRRNGLYYLGTVLCFMMTVACLMGGFQPAAFCFTLTACFLMVIATIKG